MIQRTACLIARGNDPCRNLAIEKHLMDTLPENTAILYLWQSRRAVIVGRNQNPWYECEAERFLEAGGVVTRRLSGGGAMYQDMGCLNYSLIVPKTDFDIARQTGVVASALYGAGLSAEPGPRSRLQCGGRWFCENAFLKVGSVALQHGTLLAEADLDGMERALKPDSAPTRARQDPPLRERVLNLRELNPDATAEELQRLICGAFAAAYRAQPAWLDERMMDARTVDALTARFGDPAWVYPEAANYDFIVRERFPWGKVSVLLLREGGVIRAARIFSDAMEAALFERIEQGLVGCPFLIGAIGTRFEQRLELLRDMRLLQMASDVCTLICGHIRAMDRGER